jgi:hypothetical protein
VSLLYSWEDLGGGAVSPVTLDLYVALLMPLGPVGWRICWRCLERCRCFLRVLEWARGFVVSQHRGGCELVPLAEG